ncbi:DNA alkylation repair protein [bacterium]|nr:DNA alkylation repair protein [bacterium]
MSIELTAAAFTQRLLALRSDAELARIQRYFKSEAGAAGSGDTFAGVKMGSVFALAKEHLEMPPGEIEVLLEHEIHEVRAGALSIMGKQFGHRKTTPERRQELCELYLRRHDRVNNWDLVDLGALYVLGPWLVDKALGGRERKILYKLAKSKNIWERRSAIVATGPLIKRGEVDDCFAVALLLLNDPEDLVHKGTGWMLRAAGDVDRPRLLAFLDEHAGSMPRVLLRYSIEKLSPEQRRHYLAQ